MKFQIPDGKVYDCQLCIHDPFQQVEVVLNKLGKEHIVHFYVLPEHGYTILKETKDDTKR